MVVTTNFYEWFYNGLSGLGGWFLFFLLALAAVIFVLYDTQKRHLPAIGWKMGTILAACLLVPAIIFRFSSLETQVSIANFAEAIFYLGLLGGVLPAVLAVGYYVTFQGLTGCSQGHVYDDNLRQCPECNRINRQQTPPPPLLPPDHDDRRGGKPGNDKYEAPRPKKPKAGAFLSSGNRTYQLFKGTTTIGKSTKNDIVLDDGTVSREHAKIVEDNGHFKLIDLGSTNGTYVNGHVLKKQRYLEPDDEIGFGPEIKLRFINPQ